MNLRKSKLLVWFLLSSAFSISYSQNEYVIASYNLLNYPGNTSAIRNPYFRTVIENIQPDVLVVQEMLSQAGVNEFLINVMNVASSGFVAGTFLDGPDTDNAIFYKTASFTFLANNPIQTDLRNISEFVLRENSTGDTLRIYSLHLKAGNAASEQQQRLSEVTTLRNVTDNLPQNSNFIVCGDFNIYGSNEACYQKLLNQTTPGYFEDIYSLSGSWNNSAFSQYHTQSPRVRQFGGGANGGMDDRFDMILFSKAVLDSEKIYYLPNSFINYGNDGNHYNDSINKPPNAVVSQQIADAIHYSSDHIPIFAKFRFEQSGINQIAVDLIDGWNIISIPMQATDMTGTILFPTAISPFYSFGTGYLQVSVLENGKGYWAKFSGSQNATITGTFINTNEISVNQGWNLIGPFSTEVPVASITTVPSNIISSAFYGYDGGYNITGNLHPGKGYWIKVSAAGVLHLNSTK
jgi:exonuclease III